MKVIDNKLEKFGDDIKREIKLGDKFYIASAVFSMYGFNELKNELNLIDGFDFIFTNPTFIKEEKEHKTERLFEINKLPLTLKLNVKVKNNSSGKSLLQLMPTGIPVMGYAIDDAKKSIKKFGDFRGENTIIKIKVLK